MGRNKRDQILIDRGNLIKLKRKGENRSRHRRPWSQETRIMIEGTASTNEKGGKGEQLQNIFGRECRQNPSHGERRN